MLLYISAEGLACINKPFSSAPRAPDVVACGKAVIITADNGLCEAASLRQAFFLPIADTLLPRLGEACLTTLFALVRGGSLAAAHDGVR
jgi:hypothetical protein